MSPSRVALGVEYHGGYFHGFQRQPHASSVQQALEEALSSICAHPVSVVTAGRTDAGVHATQQVVSFNPEVERPNSAWIRGVNTKLPKAVRIHWAREVAADFHARFSARSRRYIYVMYRAPQRSAQLHGLVTWCKDNLDVAAMQAACTRLIGTRDFSSVRAAGCQAQTPRREITAMAVRELGEFLLIDVTANAFLLHMVRNIAGVLTSVGRGEHDAAWVEWLIEQQDRTLAPPTAASDGLYLVHVGYASLDIPARAPGILAAAAPAWL